MLSNELQRFVTNWREKAASYSSNEVEDCYNKYFTLFVVFNRLYAEATFELARRGEITLQPNRSLPDRKGATEYTLKFIGLNAFEALYQNGLDTSLNKINAHLEEGHFFIKLKSPEGNRQPQKDQQLLRELRSSGQTKATAVLDLIYSIRCNLFHGNKAFEPVQVDLLAPAISILTLVIDSLYEALNR